MNDTPDESKRREWMADLARADQVNASLVDRFIENRGDARTLVSIAEEYHGKNAKEIRALGDDMLETLFTLGCMKTSELFASTGLKMTDADGQDGGAATP